MRGSRQRVVKRQHIADAHILALLRILHFVCFRNLLRFLTDGDKTKITLRFRGREMAHQELGVALLKRVEADLAALGQVEQWPKLEGRQMVMIIAPKKKN